MKARYLGFAMLVIAVVSSALAVVAVRHQGRVAFVALQLEKVNRDHLVMEYGQLQLEESTWATHGRVERLAMEKLNMIIPAQADIVLVRR